MNEEHVICRKDGWKNVEEELPHFGRRVQVLVSSNANGNSGDYLGDMIVDQEVSLPWPVLLPDDNIYYIRCWRYIQ